MECDSLYLALYAHHGFSGHPGHPQFSGKNAWFEVSSRLLLSSLFKLHSLLFFCLFVGSFFGLVLFGLVWLGFVGVFFLVLVLHFRLSYVYTSLYWSWLVEGGSILYTLTQERPFTKPAERVKWHNQLIHFYRTLWVRNPLFWVPFMLRYF